MSDSTVRKRKLPHDEDGDDIKSEHGGNHSMAVSDSNNAPSHASHRSRLFSNQTSGDETVHLENDMAHHISRPSPNPMHIMTSTTNHPKMLSSSTSSASQYNHPTSGYKSAIFSSSVNDKTIQHQEIGNMSFTSSMGSIHPSDGSSLTSSQPQMGGGGDQGNHTQGATSQQIIHTNTDRSYTVPTGAHTHDQQDENDDEEKVKYETVRLEPNQSESLDALFHNLRRTYEESSPILVSDEYTYFKSLPLSASALGELHSHVLHAVPSLTSSTTLKSLASSSTSSSITMSSMTTTTGTHGGNAHGGNRIPSSSSSTTLHPTSLGSSTTIELGQTRQSGNPIISPAFPASLFPHNLLTSELADIMHQTGPPSSIKGTTSTTTTTRGANRQTNVDSEKIELLNALSPTTLLAAGLVLCKSELVSGFKLDACDDDDCGGLHVNDLVDNMSHAAIENSRNDDESRIISTNIDGNHDQSHHTLQPHHQQHLPLQGQDAYMQTNAQKHIEYTPESQLGDSSAHPVRQVFHTSAFPPQSTSSSVDTPRHSTPSGHPQNNQNDITNDDSDSDSDSDTDGQSDHIQHHHETSQESSSLKLNVVYSEVYQVCAYPPLNNNVSSTFLSHQAAPPQQLPSLETRYSSIAGNPTDFQSNGGGDTGSTTVTRPVMATTTMATTATTTTTQPTAATGSTQQHVQDAVSFPAASNAESNELLLRGSTVQNHPHYPMSSSTSTGPYKANNEPSQPLSGFVPLPAHADKQNIAQDAYQTHQNDTYRKAIDGNSMVPPLPSSIKSKDVVYTDAFLNSIDLASPHVAAACRTTDHITTLSSTEMGTSGSRDGNPTTIIISNAGVYTASGIQTSQDEFGGGDSGSQPSSSSQSPQDHNSSSQHTAPAAAATSGGNRSTGPGLAHILELGSSGQLINTGTGTVIASSSSSTSTSPNQPSSAPIQNDAVTTTIVLASSSSSSSPSPSMGTSSQQHQPPVPPSTGTQSSTLHVTSQSTSLNARQQSTAAYSDTHGNSGQSSMVITHGYYPSEHGAYHHTTTTTSASMAPHPATMGSKPSGPAGRGTPSSTVTTSGFAIPIIPLEGTHLLHHHGAAGSTASTAGALTSGGGTATGKPSTSSSAAVAATTVGGVSTPATGLLASHRPYDIGTLCQQQSPVFNPSIQQTPTTLIASTPKQNPLPAPLIAPTPPPPSHHHSMAQNGQYGSHTAPAISGLTTTTLAQHPQHAAHASGLPQGQPNQHGQLQQINQQQPNGMVLPEMVSSGGRLKTRASRAAAAAAAAAGVDPHLAATTPTNTRSTKKASASTRATKAAMAPPETLPKASGSRRGIKATRQSTAFAAANTVTGLMNTSDASEHATAMQGIQQHGALPQAEPLSSPQSAVYIQQQYPYNQQQQQQQQQHQQHELPTHSLAAEQTVNSNTLHTQAQHPAVGVDNQQHFPPAQAFHGTALAPAPTPSPVSVPTAPPPQPSQRVPTRRGGAMKTTRSSSKANAVDSLASSHMGDYPIASMNQDTNLAGNQRSTRRGTRASAAAAAAAAAASIQPSSTSLNDSTQLISSPEGIPSHGHSPLEEYHAP